MRAPVPHGADPIRASLGAFKMRALKSTEDVIHMCIPTNKKVSCETAALMAFSALFGRETKNELIRPLRATGSNE